MEQVKSYVSFKEKQHIGLDEGKKTAFMLVRFDTIPQGWIYLLYVAAD